MRHQAVVRIVNQAINAAGGYASTEAKIAEVERTAPDLKVYFGGKLTFVDVVITDSCAKSHVKRSEGRQLAAADYAEGYKNDRYLERAKLLGGDFLPFNLEALGGWGRGARQVVELVRRGYNPEHASMPWEEVRRLLTHGVACAVQRWNARITEQWLGLANVTVGDFGPLPREEDVDFA